MGQADGLDGQGFVVRALAEGLLGALDAGDSRRARLVLDALRKFAEGLRDEQAH